MRPNAPFPSRATVLLRTNMSRVQETRKVLDAIDVEINDVENRLAGPGRIGSAAKAPKTSVSLRAHLDHPRIECFLLLPAASTATTGPAVFTWRHRSCFGDGHIPSAVLGTVELLDP